MTKRRYSTFKATDGAQHSFIHAFVTVARVVAYP